MHTSFSTILPTLLTTLLLLPLTSSTPLPLPPQPQKRCTNALLNPSFESSLPPWLDIVQGSFTSTRGVYTSSSGGHTGRNFYYALSNSTIDASLTLSQTFTLPSSLLNGGEVECSAWVASRRPGNVGSTRVEVFLDGVSCGGTRYLGTTGWMKVGAGVRPSGDAAAPHTIAIVFMSDEASEEGWSLWVDDVVVGQGC